MDGYKGLIVVSHGLGGGGHNSYMDVADFFAQNGYLVFAYDATGNEEFANLPIMLFGHSWGAYSAGCVLNIHTDIKGTVMFSGFNTSMDMIEEEGQRLIGGAMKFFIPYLKILEKSTFGSYAGYNRIEGIMQSDSQVMVVHSVDDDMVSYKNYQLLYDEFKNNKSVIFKDFKDRGHNYIYYSDNAHQYREQFNAESKTFVESLDGELTAEIKTEYMNKHLEKNKFFDLDKELFDEILEFYDRCIE